MKEAKQQENNRRFASSYQEPGFSGRNRTTDSNQQKKKGNIMNIRKFKNIIFAFALMAAILVSGIMPETIVQAKVAYRKKISILMVGNSLTYSSKHKNNTISHLKTLGKRNGYSFSIKYVAHDGEHLRNYAGGKKKRLKELRKAINQKRWDVVVLQENTDDVIKRSPAFQKSVASIAALVRKKSPKARIILNCTWAYDKKVFGYTHMQQQACMDAMYSKAARAVKASVVYSGDAFDARRKVKGSAYLYRSDKNHPSNAGCYLNACCLYKGITGR